MNTIIRFFFSIWATFFFMFWIIVAYFAYLLTSLFFGNKRDRQFLIFLYRFIGNAICYSIFLFVKRKIHAVYSKDESYVIVSNHQSMMDIPANVVGSPDDILFKFLGKKEADRVPFFGYLINRLFILVDRKSEVSRKMSFQKMKTEMENGFSILIYAEGTRNRTDEPIKDFYDGAFRLAIEMQKPIVVNVLVGIKELNPPTGFFTYRPGTIESHWEEAIPTKGLSLDNMDDLKAQVAELMIKRLA
ncbi:MAG: 1-acyl-sn-glycerol-3-phosphate acyltransferase [Chitinophagales bacterium]|jgi:1-acyl-sn-glycerol-3-phosphate acyltransferase